MTVAFDASLAVIVRLFAAAAVWVAVAERTNWVAAPEATVATVAVLVDVQPRQYAVTVYEYVPAARPESLQVVTGAGAAVVGHVPPALPAPRWTEYVTVPVPGGVTAVQVTATVPAPGVALVMDGVPEVPTLATAPLVPLLVKYANTQTETTIAATATARESEACRFVAASGIMRVPSGSRLGFSRFLIYGTTDSGARIENCGSVEGRPMPSLHQCVRRPRPPSGTAGRSASCSCLWFAPETTMRIVIVAWAVALPAALLPASDVSTTEAPVVDQLVPPFAESWKSFALQAGFAGSVCRSTLRLSRSRP